MFIIFRIATLIILVLSFGKVSYYNGVPNDFVKGDLSVLSTPFGDFLEPETLEDLMIGVAGIVIGTPVGVPETFVYSIDQAIPYPMREKAESSFGFTVTKFSFEIEEILLGSYSNSQINIIQTGDNSENFEYILNQRKMKPGIRYLVMLTQQDPNDGCYGPSLAEASIFYVDTNDRIYSMSEYDICTKQDGMTAYEFVDLVRRYLDLP